ncbi:hypothetical protein GUJ93_ZPchr0012g21498 [Zizania palustris]|uniref:DUF7792 domain-containing protein n=1 Tax=Zizania palustris TaxID=103762 RepID=A0A8J6BWF3_ZIZPA|nr:hypothetical protein GUJ93_ZPchr0012g21498 [Zizania palustris]
MGEGVKAMLARPIQLADEVAKQCGAARCFRAECAELKVRADKLAALLRQAARADLYDRPAARIMAGAAQALAKASSLAARCASGHPRLKRLFTLSPAAGFPRTVALLDTALEDVAWLLRISSPHAGADDEGGDSDGDLRGLPNIAQNEPILFLIWDHVARLHTGGLAARADSAANLASLARDNQHFAKLIIEEDGVPPLLRLLKEGTDEGQEAAARALGLLGCDAENVDKLVQAGVCSVSCHGAQGPAHNNAVRYLVGHLASGTIQEHSRYSVGSSSSKNSTSAPHPMTSLHSVVLAKTLSMRHGTDRDTSSTDDPPRMSNGSKAEQDAKRNQMQSVVHSAMAAKTRTNGSLVPPFRPQLGTSGSSGRGSREVEDPETKAHLKAMAAKALWKLARSHLGVCKSITDSRALLCFAVLLEKGDGGMGTWVQHFSAMAIMEISRVAEHSLALRQSAFKPSSPAAKAVVDQLLHIVSKGEFDDLLLPCITALGCLARTFTASETRVIAPLVELLDEREPLVTKEAVLALTKFACTDNHLRVNHCKAIVDNGGARHLVQLVYLGDEVQIEALILLCYIASHVPESEELAQAGVLAVLLWASKQAHMVQDMRVEMLLPDAKGRLELFQSRAR